MATRKDARARDELKAETREALLQAATDLFAREGLATPSLDAICQRAGFTRGAFYVHFKDREELVAAVMERTMGVFLGAMLSSDGAAGDIRVVVNSFAAAVAGGFFPFTRNGGLASHHLGEACASSDKVRRRFQGVWKSARQQLSQAVMANQARGEVTLDVPGDALATVLVAAALGFQQLLELDVDVDVPGAAAAVLTLASAPKAPPRRRPAPHVPRGQT
jgi:AcrR family transcriptional regulator